MLFIFINMLKLMCLSLLVSVNILADNVGDEDIDPVIDLLLNGKSYSDEHVTDDFGKHTAGIWKCGNCTNLDNSKIVYSEENDIEANDDNDNDVDTKIELVLAGMRCVTVTADKPGVVQRITGACNGAVTLHMTPARRFVVHVYV